MRIVIAVASANAALRAYLAANRNGAAPPEMLARGYLKEKAARFSVQVFALTPTTTSDDLGVWLRDVTRSSEGAIVVIDEDHRALMAPFEDAYFIASFPPYPGRVLQNQVRSALAPILRHFVSYSERFDALKNQRILLLPLDIFQSVELTALRTRLTLAKMRPGLADDLDGFLAALDARARPKSRRRGKTIYLVDDRPLWYRYGPERHAIVQTIKPTHPEQCWHLSRYRFGRLYDDRLHHNVDDDSKPTKVYGQFSSCHGQAFAASGQSHLNVFPNGYV